MITREDYLRVLKTSSSLSPCYKIEILNEDDTPKTVITDDILSGGSINVKVNNGQRRTASLTVYNGHHKYSIKPGSLFYGTKLKLYAGVIVKDEPWYEPQGIFYIQQLTPTRSAGVDSISLTLVDKWGKLDGTIFGKVPSRIEYNKSETVYRNTSVYVSGTKDGEGKVKKISSAAVRMSDFGENSTVYTFTNPTEGTNNSLVGGGAGEIPFVYDFQKGCSIGFTPILVATGVSNYLGFKLKYKKDNYTITIGFYSSNDDASATIEDSDGNRVSNVVNESFGDDIMKGDIPHGVVITENKIALQINGKEYLKLERPKVGNEYKGGNYFNLSYNIDGSTKVKSLLISNTSYIINYDYNMYDIIRNTLKKSTRYDIRVIDYLSSKSVSSFDPTNEGEVDKVNRIIETKIEDLYSVTPYKDYIQLVSNNKIYRCISNEWSETKQSYSPQWEEYSIGNGEVLDSVAPILDPYYEPVYNENGTKVKVYDEWYDVSALPYGMLTLPKSITQDRGGTEAGILTSIADLLSAEIGYNRYGQLFLSPAGREINTQEKSVIWRFKYEDYLISTQETINYSNLINYVVVVGSTTDGVQLSESVANNDVSSDYCIQKIGVIPYIYKLDYSYDPEQWNPANADSMTEAQLLEARYKAIHKNMKELAEWYLQRNGHLQTSLSITCGIIPHMEENRIIELQNREGKYERYLVDSFNLPIGFSGTMTINLTKVGD